MEAKKAVCMTTAAAVAAGAGMLAGAGSAMAAGNGVIDSITNAVVDDALMPIYYAILTIIGVVALIFLVKEIASAAFSSGGMQKNQHITQCIVILAACLIMAFAPNILNWVFDLSQNQGAEASITLPSNTGGTVEVESGK